MAAPTPLYGGWTMLGVGESVEALAKAPVDFVGVDLQHGAFGFRETVQAIQLLDALGMPAYVRLSRLDLPIIPRVLDFGATGVIVAMIETVDQAAEAVAAARYPAEGTRSYGGQRYGLRPEPDDVRLVRPEVHAMVETRGAVASLDEIASIHGLAGLFVGPVDLRLALGEQASMLTGTCVRNADRPDCSGRAAQPAAGPWREAVERTVEAARQRGIDAGTFATDGKDAHFWRALGYHRIVISSDIALLRAAIEREVSAARSAL